MRPAVTFSSAEGVPLGALSSLWNRAYEGYAVPLVFDPVQLAWHITRSDVSLAGSLIASVDGEAAGLSLAAVRGKSAWIGGFGVAAEHRRKGIAGRLMQEHLSRLRSSGVGSVRLEVIDVNPAREVYRRCGFREVRDLLVLGGRPSIGAAGRLEDISIEDLSRAHARLHPRAPTWRRNVPTLAHDVESGAEPLVVRRGKEVAAFAVAEVAGDWLRIQDAAAADAEAASLLLASLSARWPERALRIVDEPPDTALAAVALEGGLTIDLRQVEMVAE